MFQFVAGLLAGFELAFQCIPAKHIEKMNVGLASMCGSSEDSSACANSSTSPREEGSYEPNGEHSHA